MAWKTLNVILQPNSHMKKFIEAQCNYRRYCWNQALAYWNDLYDFYNASQIDDIDRKIMSKDEIAQFEMTKDEAKIFKQEYYPTEFKIRNYLIAHKEDWEKQYSSRIVQWTCRDLAHAFKAFFNEKQIDAKHPKFHFKKLSKMSFKTDRIKIINGKLRLDKAHDYKDKFYDIRIRGLKKFNGQLKLVNIAMVNDQYIATLFYDDSENQVVNYTNKTTAIDINVGHLNYTDGILNVLTKRINKLYKTNEKYHKLLSYKRNIYKKHLKYLAKDNGITKIDTEYHPSHSYNIVLNKLKLNYKKIVNLQNDIYHKFSKFLVDNYDWITIENLNVKAMKMGFASKGIHKTGFAKLRRLLEYKCEWYGKHLVIADRFYSSTQICSMCGFRKTGDEKITLYGNKKHQTKHEQYICYQCGYKCDRDQNAVNNLERLSELAKEKFLKHEINNDLTLNGQVMSITNI